MLLIPTYFSAASYVIILVEENNRCCISLFTLTSSSKFFRENSELMIEPERVRQNKSFLKLTLCVYHFLFGNYRTFAKQHTKSIGKHKPLELIAPKQVKTDMPCRNKKSLNFGAFSDTSVRFSR